MHSLSISPADWWTVEPGTVLGLTATAFLYSRGHYKFHRAGLDRVFRGGALRFWLGWFILVVALVSPVHALSGWLFWVHMTQHELLMVAAAPLLIGGRIGLVFLKGLPVSAARGLAGALEKSGLTALYTLIRRPLLACAVQTAVLWVWHLPALFNAALQSPWIHACEHAYFLGAAMFFWDSILGPRSQATPVSIFFSLFLTTVQCSALGALLALSSSAWYRAYELRAPFWGLTAAADQQIGGLIMWIPAGLVYIFVALKLMASWLSPRVSHSHPYSLGAVSNKLSIVKAPG